MALYFNKTKVLRMFLFCLCSVGCVYQVFYVNREYFEYKTTTRVVSNVNNIIRYPSLILCLRISDFVNASELSKHNLISFNHLHNLTIKQLHELTPPPQDSILSCLLRIDSREYYKVYPKNVCYKYFNVSKSIVSYNVCYQFIPRLDLNYSITEVANAFNSSYSVYELILSNHFINLSQIYLSAHYTSLSEDNSHETELPVHSRKFGEPFIHYRYYESWVMSRPIEEVFTMLPAPYDTDCVNNNDKCYPSCMIKRTVEEMGRFPYTEAVDDALFKSKISPNLRILGGQELDYAYNASKWRKILNYCSDHCRKPSCVMSVTSNVVFAIHDLEDFLSANEIPISLAVLVPSSYGKEVTAVPDVSWIEYISGVTNSLSIWFGVSVIAINPMKYIFRQGNNSPTILQRYSLLIYYLICLTGFLYQSGEIGRDYFKYKTSVTVEVSTGDQYSYQSIGICIDYNLILNRTQFKEYGFQLTAPSPFQNFETWGAQNSALTVEAAFNLTPSNQDILAKCGIMKNTNIGFDQLNSKECLKIFSVEKAVRGTKMCYYFIPRERQTYSWTKVASSFRDTGQVYEITTSLQLNRSMEAIAITDYPVYDDDQKWANLPLESRNFAQRAMLFPENILTLASSTNIFFRLPSPYDTRCRVGFQFQSCLHYCVNKHLKRINRRPHFSFLNWPARQKVLNSLDMRNSSIASMAVSSFRSCSTDCHGFPCERSVSFTIAQTYYRRQSSNLMLISFLPRAPTLNVYYMPQTDPLNFFIYICNCFGIWFGLSISSVNPAALYKKGLQLLHRGSPNITTGKNKLFIPFLAICFSGFIWQAYLVSMTYFTYKSHSRIQILTQDIFRFPTINVCFNYKEILNNSSIDAYYSTVEEIFSKTPRENETLFGCRLRNLNSDRMILKHNTQCHTEFKSRKYIKGLKVCYAFTPSSAYSITRVTSASSHTGIVFELLLHPILNNAHHLSFFWFTQPLNTIKKGLPTRSKNFPIFVFRDSTDNDSVNYFVAQGVTHNITLLPEPYDTQCLPNRSPIICFSQCYTKYVMSSLNRVPFDEGISEPYPLKILSEVDLSNDSIRESVDFGNNKCRKECRRQDCNQYYSITDVSGYWQPRTLHNGLVIAAGTPSSNGLFINSYPSLTLRDFLNNLAVSASVWLGVSVLSIVMFPVKSLSMKRLEKPKSRIHRLKPSGQQSKACRQSSVPVLTTRVPRSVGRVEI